MNFFLVSANTTGVINMEQLIILMLHLITEKVSFWACRSGKFVAFRSVNAPYHRVALHLQISVLHIVLDYRLGTKLKSLMSLQWDNRMDCYQEDDVALEIMSSSPKIDKKIISICLAYTQKCRTPPCLFWCVQFAC